MMAMVALIITICFLAGVGIGQGLYIHWRLGRLNRGLYHTGWDIDAVLARLAKHEEQGH
jgi:hypothetical protein